MPERRRAIVYASGLFNVAYINRDGIWSPANFDGWILNYYNCAN